MPRKPRIHNPGAVYHVILRGNAKGEFNLQVHHMSSEIILSGLPTLWSEGEGNMMRREIASGVSNPRSLRPSACTQTLCT